MPVPVNITDLSETASINSPAGSETVGPQANDYLQALSSFIRKIYDGAITPLAALNVNAQKITNLAQGSTTSTSTDVLTGAQVRAMSYKVGEIRMWAGPISQATITSVWGPGWYLADGNNGTINLADRFPVAAGRSYNFGDAGGVATYALSVAQLPPHNHGVNDPQHLHGLGDPGHAHPVNDGGHAHAVPGSFAGVGTSYSQEGTNTRLFNINNNPSTDVRASNISIAVAGTGIYMGYAPTGISIQSTGSGAAIENRPPYMALTFIQYTGAGA